MYQSKDVKITYKFPRSRGHGDYFFKKKSVAVTSLCLAWHKATSPVCPGPRQSEYMRYDPNMCGCICSVINFLLSSLIFFFTLMYWRFWGRIGAKDWEMAIDGFHVTWWSGIPFCWIRCHKSGEFIYELNNRKISRFFLFWPCRAVNRRAC